jgi:VIT1/CCC1 family predicted Fe2+/Mn2+ transporter
MNFLINLFIADPDQWALNLRDWLITEAKALAIAAVVIIIIPFIIKKAWAALAGTLIASGIALYFVSFPDVLGNIGKAIAELIFGG